MIKGPMFYFTMLTLAVCILVSGCDQLSMETAQRTTQKNERLTTPPQADKEDQWEYLVVTFGKTLFSDIEDSITTGRSKLVAFQEFADLLSGSEAVEAQTKLDLLGRFGWELVSTVGSIGGDQQLVMKRPRLEGRIEAEQKALRSLSEVLRSEKTKQAERVAALIKEMNEKESSQVDPDSLMEMDAIDLRQRLANAKATSEANILTVLPKVGDDFGGGTISAASVTVRASASSLTSEIKYSGEIKIEIDGTTPLLYESNKYRSSAADKLAQQVASSIKGRKYLNGAMKYNAGDFDITAITNITFSGKVYPVGMGAAEANSREYKGTWAE